MAAATTTLTTILTIPLLLSACITTFVSILVLSFRISIFYIELCYSIIANYFVIPVSTDESSLSLLSFVASEPSTPGVATAGPGSGPVFKGRVVSGLDGFQTEQHNPATTMRRLSSSSTAATTAATPLQSFVSDDENRDFEGVGGWHCGTQPGLGNGIIRASTSTSPVWRHSLTSNHGRRRHHRRSVTAPMAQDRTRRMGSSISVLPSNRSESGDYFGLGHGGGTASVR